MGNCKSLLLFLAIAAATNGCAKVLNPYEEHFNCKAPTDDGRCLDTPTAYQEAITDPGFDAPVQGKNTGTGIVKSPKQEAQAIRYRLLADLLTEPQPPLLEPPRVLRVLLLPYRGQDDELFLARHVFIKVEESSWALTDLVER